MWNRINSGETLYWGWLIAWLAVLLIAGMVGIYRRYQRIKRVRNFIQESTPDEKETYINKIIAPAGFLYDGRKDIFYSRENGWQKKYGYSKIYDDAAPILGMVIDCEPIYFHYDGRKWMLEMWKGQYGMTVGGEVGLYLAVNGHDQFYRGVEPEEYIGMQMELFHRGTRIFGRRETHWWLTGFRLGEWAYPWEMKMAVTLTFLNRQMCQRFLEGLRQAGYQTEEYQARGETVKILYYIPHTKQPISRKALLDRIRIKYLAFFCRLYHFYTREYQNTCDKLIALQIKAPRLFAKAMRIGKTNKLFEKDKRYV